MKINIMTKSRDKMMTDGRPTAVAIIHRRYLRSFKWYEIEKMYEDYSQTF